MDKRTLNYYNDNYLSIYQNSKDIDLSDLYKEFESYLESGNNILDLGCGIGRDIKYFEKNYYVEGIDASDNLVKIARRNTNSKIYNSTYKEVKLKMTYNGVWALAALVHMEDMEIIDTINRISTNLIRGGIFYTSFKKGEFKGYIGDRYFNYMTEDRLKEISLNLRELKVKKIFYTDDKMDRKNTRWINVIYKKL